VRMIELELVAILIRTLWIQRSTGTRYQS